MIESEDASKVTDTLAKNLLGVSKNAANFQKLPDTFWGYYARGHDTKGTFGVFITYSESSSDVDDLIKIYEDWISKNKQKTEIK